MLDSNADAAANAAPATIVTGAEDHARCPQCGRLGVGRAFASTANYLRCPNGHVFAAEEVGR